MDDPLLTLLAGAAGGLVSAIVTYFSTKAKIRLDLAAEYDKDLQESRLRVYKELWAFTEPLARYGRSVPVTYSELRKVSDLSRDWYFQTGGIYLTKASRGPYFEWKRVMEPLLSNENADDVEVPKERLKVVIDAASRLRSSLSDDIGTRRLTRV